MNDFWRQLFGDRIPTVEYCEAALEGIIARPGYFISNFAYLFIGIFLILKKDNLAKIFGIISIIIGIFSGLYDASFKFNSQIFDLLAMFALINFLFVFNLSKLFSLKKYVGTIIALIFELVYLIGIIKLEGSSGRIIFGVFVLGVLITEFVLYKKGIVTSMKYFIIAFITFLVGFVIWTFDATQTLCSPVEWLNGRAIYHYITAITIYYLYLHNKEK